MGRKFKKGLSLCLGLALSVTAVPLNAAELSRQAAPDISDDLIKPLAAELPSRTRPAVQRFTAMTLGSSGDLSVGGKNVGNEYGGVSVSDTAEITVTDGGRQFTLEEAVEELGFTTVVNSAGDTIITAPFQTARLIVRTADAFSDPSALSVEMPFDDLYLVSYGSQAEAYKAFKRLSEDDSIDLVEPDAVIEIMEKSSAAFDDFDFSGSDDDPDQELVFDGDALDIDSWGRTIIGAQDYCKKLKAENAELPEIKVAVVDTGIYAEHNRFINRILDGGTSFVEGKGAVPTDENGHGSHCAGIICSSTPDNVKILPVRVIDSDGYGTDIAIYSGIMYAIDQGVDIISISLGGGYKSHLLSEAVERAHQKGITVCVAAGNESIDVVKFCSSLASIDDAVVVASIDSEMVPSYFTNFGSTVDFAAPGEEINSVSLRHPNATIRHSGTSMATPFTAAVFADVLSYDKSLTSDRLYSIVRANAVDICDPGFDDMSGWGMVNLNNIKFDISYVPVPSADKVTGKYSGSQNVRLSCHDSSADIYYTLDGSVPSAAGGIKYTAPIEISGTCRIRAVAVVDGISSAEVSEYYEIDGIENESAFIVDDGVLVKYSGYAGDLDIADMVRKGVLPEIESIGENAFRGNTYVENIVLPDSVKKIGLGAFMDCSALRNFTTRATELDESVFRGCSKLVNFNDGCLTKIGFGVFLNCASLTGISEKNITVLSDYAFFGCSGVTQDCLALDRITRFGKYCLSDSGICGDIDVSAGRYFDMGALSKTAITGVTFSPKLTYLCEELLESCDKLKNISAPAVTRICEKALALGKNKFTPETVVHTDIDFSKVTTLEFDAFVGYVFDKPVSFDSLDEDTFLNTVAGSYGEWLSLPTLKNLEGITYDIRDESKHCNEYFVNVLDVHNAVTMDTVEYDFPALVCAIKDANIVILSDDFYQYEIFPDPELYGAKCYYTEHENEYLSSIATGYFERNYTTGDIFLRNEDLLYVYTGQEINIPIISKCDGYTAEWYYHDRTLLLDGYQGELTDEEYDEYYDIIHGKGSREPEKLDLDGKYALSVTFDEPGTYVYSYRLTNDVTGDTKENLLVFYAHSPDSDVVRADYNNGQLYITDYCKYSSSCLRDAVFVPEKTGDYSLMFTGCDVEINRGNELLASFDHRYVDPPVFRFEEGETYRIRLRKRTEETPDVYYAPMFEDETYFVILSPDNDMRDISRLTNYSISFEGYFEVDVFEFEGDPDEIPRFEPEIIIMDGDKQLERDVDFECSWKTAGEGLFYYRITGLGKYYGTLCNGSQTDLPVITTDVEYTLGDHQEAFFIPAEDGIYKFTGAPTESMLDEIFEDESLSLNSLYVSSVFIFRYDRQTGDYEEVDIYEQNGFASVYGEVSSYYLKAGECYIVHHANHSMKLIVTQGETLNECSIDYKRAYDFDGTPVTPEVTITNNNGEVLTEGVDYKITLWYNDKPGIMYDLIEGSVNYPGAKTLLMTINGGGIDCEEIDGQAYLSIVDGKPFTSYRDLEYHFTVEEDAVYEITNGVYASIPDTSIKNIDDPKKSRSIEENGFYGFEKGEYIVTFELMNYRNEMVFRKHPEMKMISRDDIIIPDSEYTGKRVYPEIRVVVDGTELVKGKDYTVSIEGSPYEPGVYEAIITANEKAGNYFGSIHKNFIIKAPETQLLTDGENTVTTFADKGLEFEWYPEEENYTLFTSGYRLLNITVTDESGESVFSGDVNSRQTGELTVERGRKYRVFILSDADETVTLDIRSRFLLSSCKASWDNRIVLSNSLTAPEVTFTDGDRVLEYGKDYTIIDSTSTHTTGLQEFVFAGCGQYAGTVVIPCFTYRETFDLDADTTDLTPNSITIIYNTDEVPAYDKYIRVTSDSDGVTEYAITPLNGLFENTEYGCIAAYDENGRFIDLINGEMRFSLNKGESRYFIASPCRYSDDYEHYYATMIFVNLSVIGKSDPAAATTAPVTSSTTTTVTTTITSTETSSTTSTETTDSSTTTASTESSQPATTTSTAPAEGELPETGYSDLYKILLTLSAALTLTGAAAVAVSRRRNDG